jgi:hypothetical protein
MPAPRSTAVFVCLLVLVVAIAGCGGGSSSSSDGATTTVALPGAPYSYAVPNGFEEVPGSFPEGETPEFLTLVVPAGTEGEGYLNAYEWTLGKAEKAYSTERLLAFLDERTQSFYASEGATVTPGRDETVAGHPAVCWKIGHFENQTEGFVDADSCAIVAGHKAVEQSCSWKPATRATIQRGCKELRADLRVFPSARSTGA